MIEKFRVDYIGSPSGAFLVRERVARIGLAMG